MPWFNVQAMSDDDLRAMYRYVRYARPGRASRRLPTCRRCSRRAGRTCSSRCCRLSSALGEDLAERGAERNHFRAFEQARGSPSRGAARGRL